MEIKYEIVDELQRDGIKGNDKEMHMQIHFEVDNGYGDAGRF